MRLFFHQDLNGDGVIGMPASSATSHIRSVNREAMVTALNDDTFIFGPDHGAGFAAYAGRADTVEHDAPTTSNHQTAYLHGPQTGEWQLLLQSMNAGHDIAIDSRTNEHMNFHLADLHAGHFVIG